MKESEFSPFIHRKPDELTAGLDEIRRSPDDLGSLELIVRRPAEDEREIVATGELDTRRGLVGDTWHLRPNPRSEDGGPHPDKQLNIMNSRVVSLLSPDRDHWALAGDQLYVDFDLSRTNLPPGTQLALGSAVIEVTAQPHTGCAKFSRRFGLDALRFVNSKEHGDLRLRGIAAKVVQSGTVSIGDSIRKV